MRKNNNILLRKRKGQGFQSLTPWLFLIFALAIVVLFFLIPFLQTLFYGFTDASRFGDWNFVGFDNYVQIAHDGRFWNALINSAVYSIVVVPILVFLPLLLALLVRDRIPGITIFRTGFYVPVVVSMVSAGVIWSWILDSKGLVNQCLLLLEWVSRPIPFLTQRWLLLISAALVTIWKGLGYYMVIYLASLTNVSKDLYEAASLDGANRWVKFWHVTIPGIANTMILIAALSAVAGFKVFTEIFILSDNTAGVGGEAMTMVMLIQREFSGLEARVGYSSAMSVIMFVLTVGLMVFILRKQNDK